MNSIPFYLFLVRLAWLGYVQTADSFGSRPINLVPAVDEVTETPKTEIYRSTDERGQLCTMASLQATAIVWPQGDGSREIRFEMPDSVATNSSADLCQSNQQKPLLVISWSTIQICFFISQTDKDWAVNKIVFAYNTSELSSESKNTKYQIKSFSTLNTSEMLAPMGSSYRCISEKQFSMWPLDGSTDNATLVLSSFQMEPFLQNEAAFGNNVTMCPEDKNLNHQRRRNETVTAAVGGTFAFIAVVTVVGYSLFRYFKVKAIGYGTME